MRALPPWVWPLGAGAVARLVAATVGAGFHARDDYFHVLAPALAWVEDPTFVWHQSDTPGAGIRSQLLPRLVQGVVLALGAFGVESPGATLMGIELVLGAFSLPTIPALYLAGVRFGGPRVGLYAAWLGALHAGLVLGGTRMLLGGLAMVPMALALPSLVRPTFTWREALGLGALMGLGVWIRYPVVVAVVPMAVLWVGWCRRQTTPGRAVAGGLAWVGGFVAVAVVVQAMFDAAVGAPVLAAMGNNALANLCSALGRESWACAEVARRGMVVHTSLTRSGAWSYAGFWLLFTAPPATAVLILPLALTARRMPLVSVPWLAFVLALSLVPHKEERFMLPVLPWFVVMLAAAPGLLDEACRRWGAWLREWWPRAQRWFLVVHGAALVLATTHRSQENLREAMEALRDDPRARAVVSLGPELHTFFLRRPELPQARMSLEAFAASSGALPAARGPAHLANRVLAFEPDRDAVQIELEAAGLDCEPPRRLEGGWLDRLLWKMNPKHNRRRAPVLLWRCERPTMASLNKDRQNFLGGAIRSGQVIAGGGKAGRASRKPCP